MNNSCSTGQCATGSCASPLASSLLIFARIALGGIFVFSALMKLGIIDLSQFNADLTTLTPRDFAGSVKAFKLGLSESQISLLAYVIPWSELIAGVLLMVGFLTRGAAAIITLMMLGFIAGIASLMIRNVDVTCTCFGNIKLFCTSSSLGWCHIIRNAVFAAIATTIVFAGPGRLALDRLLRPKAC